MSNQSTGRGIAPPVISGVAAALSELIFLWEEQSQAWAKTMIDHLWAIKTAVDNTRNSGLNALPTADIDCFHTQYLRKNDLDL